jgi:RNA polymerase sigma factor (sigma-70 family)
MTSDSRRSSAQNTQVAPEGAAEKAGHAVESHDALMARLYREHNQALVRFLMTRVESEQEAQDVAHEAYVRMLQLDTQGAVSYLSAYLFRTAANIAIDRIRRGRRGQLIQRSLAQDAGIDRASALGASPDRQLASRQELELIARYAEELPPKCRQAFYLHRIEDLSLDDIASRLGVTKRMVHHYLMRAMVHCRARLDGAANPAGSEER